MPEYICEHCGRTFTAKPDKRRTMQYCSRQCSAKARIKRVYFKCEVCGTEFSMPKSHSNRTKHHFCSRKCRSTYQTTLVGPLNPNFTREIVKCDYCGNEFYKKKSHTKRNKNHFCSRKCHNAYVRESLTIKNELRVRRIKYLTSNRGKKTSIEIITAKALSSVGVPFMEQVNINNRFCVDFLIPDYLSKGLVLEVLGNYYHANPLFYGDNKKPLDEIQRKARQNDRRKYNYLMKCGYKVIGIWEKDIMNDINEALRPVLDYLTKGIETPGVNFEHVI